MKISSHTRIGIPYEYTPIRVWAKYAYGIEQSHLLLDSPLYDSGVITGRLINYEYLHGFLQILVAVDISAADG